MSKTRRLLISCGISCAFMIAFISETLFVRALRVSEWVSTLTLWILAWPVLLAARFVPFLNAGGLRMAIIALLSGFVLDVGILAALTYGALSIFKRTPSPSSLPPPPSFE